MRKCRGKCQLIGFTIFLAVVSFLPVGNLGLTHNDKLDHIIAFFFLSSFIMRLNKEEKFTIWMWIVLLLAAVGVEVGQHILPTGREGDFFDFLASYFGVVTYGVYHYWIRPRKRAIIGFFRTKQEI